MVSQAQAEATARYTEKTYLMVNIKLRKEDDADIIEYIRKAQEEGLTSREWLRELFEK